MTATAISDKSLKHWTYWTRMNNMALARYTRAIALWKSIYGVRPRGYEFGPDGGRIHFEEAA